jgi:hypothetical protein
MFDLGCSDRPKKNPLPIEKTPNLIAFNACQASIYNRLKIFDDFPLMFIGRERKSAARGERGQNDAVVRFIESNFVNVTSENIFCLAVTVQQLFEVDN